MNRREFLQHIGGFGVVVGAAMVLGHTASPASHAAPATDDATLEGWLLATGKDDLDPDLYRLVTEPYRVYLPLVGTSLR